MPLRGAVLAVFVIAFIALGTPRWLDRGGAPATERADAFAQLCRSHGGTPAGAVCTVRYGGRTYRVDAVTTKGFDADAADFNRRGCETAAQAPGARRFVFHADTGVCENAG